jgi:hypothetical protein
MTLKELLQCTKPIYEDIPEPEAYRFLGSSFVVEFRQQVYLVTAGHIIEERPIDSLVVVDSITKRHLPFGEYYPPKSKKDCDDLWIAEIKAGYLDAGEHARLSSLLLDRQADRRLSALPRNAHLAIKGYPEQKGQVDSLEKKLTNITFSTDALFKGPDPRPGLYWARYLFEDGEDPPVTNHDGMCGSPWVVAAKAPEWISLLAGIHVEGGQVGNREYQATFIGVDVLIERLKEIR